MQTHQVTGTQKTKCNHLDKVTRCSFPRTGAGTDKRNLKAEFSETFPSKQVLKASCLLSLHPIILTLGTPFTYGL